MGQSVYNLMQTLLVIFLWGLLAVGCQVGQKPQRAGPHVTNIHAVTVLVMFPATMRKYLTSSYVRGEGFILAYSLRGEGLILACLRGLVYHGRESMVSGIGGNWLHCIHSQEAESERK